MCEVNVRKAKWSSYHMIQIHDNVIIKKVNVSTDPDIVRERLQRLQSTDGIITDRSLEVTAAAAVSTTLTLGLVIASSIEIQVFRNNGIDITSLWSLWTIVLALSLNLFIATVTTDWNWYYFLRLKSLEKSIQQRHLEMINCCKHDLLHALSFGHLEDVLKVVNEGTSFIPKSMRNGDIALKLSYNIEDLELASANIWKHYSGGYRMKDGEICKTLIPSDKDGNIAHFSFGWENQCNFSGKHKVNITKIK
jgi:hypothetical protein